MILWHDNIVNSNLDYENLVSKIVVDEYYEKRSDMHTTYLKDGSPDMILEDFYKDVIKKFMLDLGLYHRSQYLIDFWTQVYSGNNKSSHNKHDHFQSDVILSWVHFLKPPKQKCFCFIDSNGNETFPETQKQNDFIVFPSWAVHRATPFISDENRVIVSGNVILDSIQSEILQSEIGENAVRLDSYTRLQNLTTVCQTMFGNVTPT
jgi:hypothetical protein|tara:strand:- start:59 stop:676 length:618 start_codon:yes stop_codon:yes gene_type:complete